MTPIKITLDWERSTKRYHVYVDPTGRLMPARIYVAQADVGPNVPAQLTVTLEA